jgi:hypothetical protein
MCTVDVRVDVNKERCERDDAEILVVRLVPWKRSPLRYRSFWPQRQSSVTTLVRPTKLCPSFFIAAPPFVQESRGSFRFSPGLLDKCLA